MTQVPATQTKDPMEELREKVSSRVRDSVGDILKDSISDEMIAGMVAKALDAAFFTPVKISDGNYNNNYKPTYESSVFVKLVETEAKPYVEKLAREWFEKHKPQLDAAFSNLMTENQLPVLLFCMLQQSQYSLQQSFSQLHIALQNAGFRS